MLDPDTQRKIHQLENELLVIEEEKRHLAKNVERSLQEERMLKHTLDITTQNLELHKSENSKNKSRLVELEDRIHQLKIQIKNQRD